MYRTIVFNLSLKGLMRRSYGPRHDKTCLRDFRQSETQTSLLSYRNKLENWNVARLDMILSNKRITKALIRLSTHNICFGWEIRKLNCWYALLAKGLLRILIKWGKIENYLENSGRLRSYFVHWSSQLCSGTYLCDSSQIYRQNWFLAVVQDYFCLMLFNLSSVHRNPVCLNVYHFFLEGFQSCM